MVKNQEPYFIVYDFVLAKLKIKGLKAFIYSVIYSYTKAGCVYHGGQGNLASRLCCSREYLNRIIKELVDEGLIKRTSHKKHPSRETSWILCQYTTVPLEDLDLDSKEYDKTYEEYYNPAYGIFDDNNFSA